MNQVYKFILIVYNSVWFAKKIRIAAAILKKNSM